MLLRLLAELAHAHVIDHALPQQADGRLAHRSAPGLEGSCGWLHPQEGAPPIPLTAPATRRSAAGPLPQATVGAVSFNGTTEKSTPGATIVSVVEGALDPLRKSGGPKCCAAQHGLW